MPSEERLFLSKLDAIEFVTVRDEAQYHFEESWRRTSQYLSTGTYTEYEDSVHYIFLVFGDRRLLLCEEYMETACNDRAIELSIAFQVPIFRGMSDDCYKRPGLLDLFYEPPPRALPQALEVSAENCVAAACVNKSAGALCQYCGYELNDDVVYCKECETPHHRECFISNRQCTTYACRCREYYARKASTV